MKFSIILAVDGKKWLWKDNDLAWRLKTDMQYFKKTTVVTENLDKINAVIMWRKTWESIPGKFRPLDNRINYVLSRNEQYSDEWCENWTNLDQILENIWLNKNIEKVFIIWGSHLYNQVLTDSRLERIYLTQLEGDFDCDVFFDWIPNNFELLSESEELEENNIKFQFKVFTKKYYI